MPTLELRRLTTALGLCRLLHAAIPLRRSASQSGVYHVQLQCGVWRAHLRIGRDEQSNGSFSHKVFYCLTQSV